MLYHLSGLHKQDLSIFELEIHCLKDSALNVESDSFLYFLSQV